MSETRELFTLPNLNSKIRQISFSNNKWILQYANTQMEKAHSEIVKPIPKS